MRWRAVGRVAPLRGAGAVAGTLVGLLPPRGAPGPGSDAPQAPDGRVAVAAASGANAIVFVGGAACCRVALPAGAELVGLAWARDLYMAAADGRVWRAAVDLEAGSAAEPALVESLFSATALAADAAGEVVVVASATDPPRVVGEGGRELAELGVHRVTALAVGAGGREVWAGDASGAVRRLSGGVGGRLGVEEPVLAVVDGEPVGASSFGGGVTAAVAGAHAAGGRVILRGGEPAGGPTGVARLARVPRPSGGDVLVTLSVDGRLAMGIEGDSAGGGGGDLKAHLLRVSRQSARQLALEAELGRLRDDVAAAGAALAGGFEAQLSLERVLDASSRAASVAVRAAYRCAPRGGGWSLLLTTGGGQSLGAPLPVGVVAGEVGFRVPLTSAAPLAATLWLAHSPDGFLRRVCSAELDVVLVRRRVAEAAAAAAGEHVARGALRVVGVESGGGEWGGVLEAADGGTVSVAAAPAPRRAPGAAAEKDTPQTDLVLAGASAARVAFVRGAMVSALSGSGSGPGVVTEAQLDALNAAAVGAAGVAGVEDLLQKYRGLREWASVSSVGGAAAS